MIYADSGKLGEAQQILHDRLAPLDGEDGSYSNWCKTGTALRGHDQTGLKHLGQVMERAYPGGELSASQVGYTYVVAGDFANTMRWIESPATSMTTTMFC